MKLNADRYAFLTQLAVSRGTTTTALESPPRFKDLSSQQRAEAVSPVGKVVQEVQGEIRSCAPGAHATMRSSVTP